LSTQSGIHHIFMVVTEMGNFTNSNCLQLNSEFRNETAIKRRINMQGITLKENCVILEKLEEPLEVLLHICSL